MESDNKRPTLALRVEFLECELKKLYARVHFLESSLIEVADTTLSTMDRDLKITGILGHVLEFIEPK